MQTRNLTHETPKIWIACPSKYLKWIAVIWFTIQPMIFRWVMINFALFMWQGMTVGPNEYSLEKFGSFYVPIKPVGYGITIVIKIKSIIDADCSNIEIEPLTPCIHNPRIPNPRTPKPQTPNPQTPNPQTPNPRITWWKTTASILNSEHIPVS